MGRPKGLDNQDEAVDFRQSGLGQKFLSLLRKRQEADLAVREAEKVKRECSQDLTAMLAEAGHKTVITPDWRVTFYQGTSASRIDGRKLLELGVSDKVILKATIKGKTYETVSVTATGAKEE